MMQGADHQVRSERPQTDLQKSPPLTRFAQTGETGFFQNRSTTVTNYHFLDRIRRTTVIGIPLIWLALFIAIPLLFVLKISFSLPQLASPPYLPLATFHHETIRLFISLHNYLMVLKSDLYFIAFWHSIKMALFTTVLCILVGYPIAYAVATSTSKYRHIWLLLIILPYWTSFLLRAYSWTIILQNQGLVNHFLMYLGVITQPIRMMHTNFAVYIGLLYGYLPYFVLPLYATLTKLDRRYIEAAYDLGANRWKSFWKVTLPLSRSGIIAGALLVFIPATGEVIIPQILGGVNTIMIGNVIWQTVFLANNWCLAATLSVIMLIILLIPMFLLRGTFKAEVDE